MIHTSRRIHRLAFKAVYQLRKSILISKIKRKAFIKEISLKRSYQGINKIQSQSKDNKIKSVLHIKIQVLHNKENSHNSSRI